MYNALHRPQQQAWNVRNACCLHSHCPLSIRCKSMGFRDFIMYPFTLTA